MPNIELHGYKEAKERRDIKSTINITCQALGLHQSAVITTCTDVVQACDGVYTSKPFLRIYGTDAEEITRIKLALKAAGLHCDVESVIIFEFEEGGSADG